MILYHGSNVRIEQIDFAKCRPYKDFGQGFYLTEFREHAEQMARRTTKIYGGKPVITAFEFDTAALERLSVKRFDAPSEEWALFVMANRSKEQMHPTHSYDIVIGPVADDDIATLFRSFSNGIIDLPMLVNGLKYKKISTQYFFHTAEAVKYLKCL